MPRKIIFRIMLALLLVIALAFIIYVKPIKLEQKIIIVPDDFPTIQEAINNANEGDKIYVRAGVYCENVVVNKTISLVGEDRNVTIIDGGGIGTVVKIENCADASLCNFSIRNSGMEITEYGFPNCGIFVNNADNIKLFNNIVLHNYVGVYLGVSYGILRNNTLKNNKFNFGVLDGLPHDIDPSNTVDGKPIFYLVGQAGVTIPLNAGYVAAINCQNIVVKNLTLENNWEGILFQNTNNSRMENLTLINNYYGVYFIGSSYNALRGNTLINNSFNFGVHGLYLHHFLHDVDTTNTINGKPIYYLVNKTKLWISSETQPVQIGYLALVNSTGCVVENLTFTNNIQGLLFAYVKDSLIRKVILRGNDQGILMISCESNIVVESHIANNGVGILLGQSLKNLLSFNNVTNNHYGISIIHSENNTVSDNNVANNLKDGFYLRMANITSILRNNITMNAVGGVVLASSHFTTIAKNKILGNLYGISGGLESRFNSIFENSIINNHYGIFGGPLGWYAKVFHNNFINNTHQVHGCNYFIWDDGYPSGGNFWSDYNGGDCYRGPYQNETGSDGIGDTPYNIDGDVDRYPLMIPWPFSDIAITDIKFLHVAPNVNETIILGVTVVNRGNSIETFQLGVNFTRLTDPLIGIQNITLTPREIKVVTFKWQPIPGQYIIIAYTSAIINDVDLSNNIKKVYLHVPLNFNLGSSGSPKIF
ncbi:MAG: NosD domain-containing protein [Candidatus Bathyarchaeia archaeon]